MEESFARQTVLEVQKDARACRDVMHVYRSLRQVKASITPEELKEGIKVQRCHRCEVANEAGVLKLLLNQEQSEEQQKAAETLLERRRNQVITEQKAAAAARKIKLKRKAKQNKVYAKKKKRK